MENTRIRSAKEEASEREGGGDRGPREASFIKESPAGKQRGKGKRERPFSIKKTEFLRQLFERKGAGRNVSSIVKGYNLRRFVLVHRRREPSRQGGKPTWGFRSRHLLRAISGENIANQMGGEDCYPIPKKKLTRRER